MEVNDQEKIIDAINGKFEGEILQTELVYDYLTITLKKDRIIEIIKHLYDHPETKFQYLTTMFGVHILIRIRSEWCTSCIIL